MLLEGSKPGRAAAGQARSLVVSHRARPACCDFRVFTSECMPRRWGRPLALAACCWPRCSSSRYCRAARSCTIAVVLVVTTPVTLLLLARAALYRDRREGNDQVPARRSPLLGYSATQPIRPHHHQRGAASARDWRSCRLHLGRIQVVPLTALREVRASHENFEAPLQRALSESYQHVMALHRVARNSPRSDRPVVRSGCRDAGI
jgi:hypothetical protein